MPVSKSLISISFHGDTIYAFQHENELFTPVRPIVENMTLDWGGQQKKLSSNKARWGVEIISIPSASGSQRAICIPVRKLAGFLATINPNKVRNELRAKIIRYQNECDDALWNYWTTGTAKRPESTTFQPTQPDLPHVDREPQLITESERDLLNTIKELDTNNRSLAGELENTRVNYIRLLETHVDLLQAKYEELKNNPIKRTNRKPRPVTEETRRAIKELAKAGLSRQEISRRLERSTATIHTILGPVGAAA
jgi:hypothetical protein